VSGLREYLAGSNDGPGGVTPYRDLENYDEWVDEAATTLDEFGLPAHRLTGRPGVRDD
jgi:hypothetical protein